MNGIGAATDFSDPGDSNAPSADPSRPKSALKKSGPIGEGQERAKSLSYGNAVLRINSPPRQNGQESSREQRLESFLEEREIDEEFDPYYGLGTGPSAPVIPKSLVFKLMDSERFMEFSGEDFTGKRQLFWILLGIGVISAAIGISYFLIMFDFQVTHHPRPLIPTVEFIEVMVGQVLPVDPSTIEEQQREGKGNYYAYTLRFAMFCVLNISNPNRKVDFYHGSIEMTLLYSGLPIGTATIANVYHPRKTLIHPQFWISSTGVPLPLQEGYTLKPEIASNNFQMVAEVITHSVMTRTALLKPQRFQTRFRCELNQLPTGELLQDCRYASADKWNSRAVVQVPEIQQDYGGYYSYNYSVVART